MDYEELWKESKKHITWNAGDCCLINPLVRRTYEHVKNKMDSMEHALVMGVITVYIVRRWMYGW